MIALSGKFFNHSIHRKIPVYQYSSGTIFIENSDDKMMQRSRIPGAAPVAQFGAIIEMVLHCNIFQDNIFSLSCSA
ncbi:hypothetical protein [Herminiimonas sp. CN]|uniref:hypothetical protein n=1 Tax=Herminiimonas sp. CN TaxID=1349818 RepID=UPI0012DEC057|nr:hypothetical protein [Herminiimonas sp. CN]